jgi:hypothetical protein
MKWSMGRNPLKKFLYTYTSRQMVSSSLTFEGPRIKALRANGPAIAAGCGPLNIRGRMALHLKTVRTHSQRGK